MREVVRLEPAAVLPAAAGVLRSQGVPPGAALNGAVQELLEAALVAVRDLAEPVAVVEEVAAETFAAIYRGEGLNAHPTPLDEIVPRASRLWLFAGTVGARLSSEITRRFAGGDPAAAVMLDAAASEAAELLVGRLEQQLAERATGRPRTAVLAYSPGYCGWHVSGQRALFAALRPEEIGITLNESCLMEPLKSVSGVLVAGHPDIHDFDDDFPFCGECATRDCRLRIMRVQEL
ncbi:MAG TPA: vitamin B12 dependent-methionine synthase activation domain-containing protein [Thermoanaerobaculales bacterium]|nr:vitamin B12 dependent-methionine synthase activation domain-containing protein [Thermoanaerobaculales bacterium]HQL29880.1 vitamin B12 dependent-methionine synthase activation domain-containing protein [Thermoanaerobaculales bacterium]